MTTLFPCRPAAIAPLLVAVLGACGNDRTPADASADSAQRNLPADSSTLLAQQKMYLSFEVTLTGERKFGEEVAADALADVPIFHCWDNAVAESFFSSLKKERIKSTSTRPANSRSRTYPTTSSPSTIRYAVTATLAE